MVECHANSMEADQLGCGYYAVQRAFVGDSVIMIKWRMYPYKLAWEELDFRSLP